MLNDVYAADRDCRSCAQNHRINNKQRKLQQFLPSKNLEYVAMKTLGSLLKKLRYSGSHRGNEPVFKSIKHVSDCLNDENGSRKDIRWLMHIQLRYHVYDTYGERSAFHIKVPANFLWRALNNIADNYGLPPTD